MEKPEKNRMKLSTGVFVSVFVGTLVTRIGPIIDFGTPLGFLLESILVAATVALLATCVSLLVLEVLRLLLR